MYKYNINSDVTKYVPFNNQIEHQTWITSETPCKMVRKKYGKACFPLKFNRTAIF